MKFNWIDFTPPSVYLHTNLYTTSPPDSGGMFTQVNLLGLIVDRMLPFFEYVVTSIKAAFLSIQFTSFDMTL